MTRRESALVALAHLDAVADHYQALHGLKIEEAIIRAAIMAQKVNRGIESDIRKWGKVKAEEPKVFLPAFRRSEQRFL